MADKRISQLTAETGTISSSDFFAIDNASSTTRKASWSKLTGQIEDTYFMTSTEAEIYFGTSGDDEGDDNFLTDAEVLAYTGLG